MEYHRRSSIFRGEGGFREEKCRRTLGKDGLCKVNIYNGKEIGWVQLKGVRQI